MKSLRFASSVMLLMGAAFAQESAPVVSDVTMAQDRSRLVTITYKLDKPAIVTLDLETNVVGTAEWVTIGGENIGSLVGDVNVYVKDSDPDVAHVIYWQPCQSWPNHVIRNNGARAVVRAWAPYAPPEWMLVDLTVKSNVHYYASMASLPFGHPTNSAYKLDKLLMRKISAAGKSFRMGIPYGEAQQFKNSTSSTLANFYTRQNPVLVSFTNDFYFGIFPVTEHQYFHVNNGKNSDGYGQSNKAEPYDECPATGFSYSGGLRGSVGNGINWPGTGHDVASNSVIDKMRKLTGIDFDLPTNAQWEYACRAGEDRYRYDGHSLYTAPGLGDICWYSENSNGKMHPVGLKKPNAWMIYDLYGSGCEWVLDAYADGYSTSDVIEPTGPVSTESNPKRVLRGKPANESAEYMSSPLRDKQEANFAANIYGFRVAAPALAK